MFIAKPWEVIRCRRWIPIDATCRQGRSTGALVVRRRVDFGDERLKPAKPNRQIEQGDARMMRSSGCLDATRFVLSRREKGRRGGKHATEHKRKAGSGKRRENGNSDTTWSYPSTHMYSRIDEEESEMGSIHRRLTFSVSEAKTPT